MGDLRLQDYVAKICRLIQDNRQDEAMAHCLHILRLYPKHIQSYYLLREACLARHSYQMARKLFHRALSADPEHLGAWLGLADSYELEGRAHQALWPAQRAFDLAPCNPRVRQKLQHLGTFHSRNGEQGKGETLLCTARALDPENLVAQEMLGVESPLPVEGPGR